MSLLKGKSKLCGELSPAEHQTLNRSVAANTQNIFKKYYSECNDDSLVGAKQEAPKLWWKCVWWWENVCGVEQWVWKMCDLGAMGFTSTKEMCDVGLRLFCLTTPNVDKCSNKFLLEIPGPINGVVDTNETLKFICPKSVYKIFMCVNKCEK